METLESIYASNLQALRKDRHLTQLELAEKLGYSDKSISKWEMGKGLPPLDVAKDIAAFFSGYGLEVDLANTTVDKVKVPKKWDDSFSAFNEVVKASGLDLAGCKGKTVEKWVALCPGRSTGEETVSGVLLVYKQQPVGAYLLSQPSGEVTALTAPADGTSGADGGASSETAVPPLTDTEAAAGADFGVEAEVSADVVTDESAQAAAPADSAAQDTAEAAAPEVSMETADIWPTD